MRSKKSKKEEKKLLKAKLKEEKLQQKARLKLEKEEAKRLKKEGRNTLSADKVIVNKESSNVATAEINGIEVIAIDRTKEPQDVSIEKAKVEKKKKSKLFKKKEKSNNSKEKKSFKKWFKNLKTWKKILYIFLTIVLVSAIVLLTVGYGFVQSILQMMQPPEEEIVTDDDGVVDFDFSLEPIDGYINIMLFGLDTRDMSTFSGSRSDMMILASINTETFDVNLTSFYRDTFTKIGHTSTYQRLNTGMFFGGIGMALDTINQTLDLNVDKYIVVNFRIVMEVIDALGGVEVNIEDWELGVLNTTVWACSVEMGDTSLYSAVPGTGLQTLNGIQALAYGRMRYDVGGDTERTNRQRTIINAVVDKVKTMKVKQVKNLIYLIAPQVKTNLKLTDILYLGVNVKKYNVQQGDGWPYDYSFGWYDNMSLIIPQSLYSNVKQLHEKVFGQYGYVPSSRVQEISDQIFLYAEEGQKQLQGYDYLRDENGNPILARDGSNILVSNGVIVGNWKLNADGTIYLDDEGYPVEAEEEVDPNEEPGGEEPGGEEPGSEEPGSEEPGSEEPGSEEPGSEEPGSEEPGGE